MTGFYENKTKSIKKHCLFYVLDIVQEKIYTTINFVRLIGPDDYFGIFLLYFIFSIMSMNK